MGNKLCQPSTTVSDPNTKNQQKHCKKIQWMDATIDSESSVINNTNSIWNATISLRKKRAHPRMTREQKDGDNYTAYEVVRLLGVGSTGTVSCVRKRRDPGLGFNPLSTKRKCLCSHQLRKRTSRATSGCSTPKEDNDALFAIKTIHSKRRSDLRSFQEFENEVETLKCLNHPHIVKGIDTFECSCKRLCIVMELLSGGCLFQRDPYTEVSAARIVSQLLSAVSYLHHHGITHRDIKHENILFKVTAVDYF